MWSVLVLSLLSVSVQGEVFFEETFPDDSWTDRWVQSGHKDDLGEFKLTAGKFYGDAEKSKGIQTSVDAKFYALSAKFDKFSNKDKKLIIQFSVKHEQSIDCGGGYIKLFKSDADQKDLHGETPYNIMFGPDICGPGTKKVHVIFNYKGKNLLIKKDIRCKDDELTHVYTLIVSPDNTYEVRIDNEKVESGKLEEDWDFLPSKQIKDPKAKKPEDWDDNEKIPDPEDKKPEDWDKPEHIPDPDAKKPEDWDDEMDGDWEPPQIENPEYKGEWKAKLIDNPSYKGKWEHPMINNPEYKSDDQLYSFDDNGVLGLDLWQVKSGSIFDNFIITDDIEEAEKHAKENCLAHSSAEKTMKEEQEKEKEKAEAEESKDKKSEETDEEEEEDEETETEPPTTEEPATEATKEEESTEEAKETKTDDHDEL